MRKFRKKNKALFIAMKIGILWYALVLTSFNFMSETNAIFTDSEVSSSSFKAGTWWDKSSLHFTDKSGFDCTEIYAFIENSGDGDMAIDSKFFVYYHPDKNPVNPEKIEGELVFADGIINKMDSQTAPQKLTYTPSKAGIYKFVAFQHPKKPGNNGRQLTIEGIPVAYSEAIEVKESCQDIKKDLNNEQSPESEEEKNQEPAGKQTSETGVKQKPEPSEEQTQGPEEEQGPQPLEEQTAEPEGDNRTEPAKEQTPESEDQQSPEPAGEQIPEHEEEQSPEPKGEQSKSLEPKEEQSEKQ